MSLARSAVRGAAWTIVTSVTSRALGLVGTLVLTRFLAPAEFGEVSAAVVLVLTANQVSTFGLGQYIVAKPTAGRVVTFHATAYHVFFGVVALAGVVAFRDRLGPFFDAPNLGVYVPGLALAILLDRFGFMPERILVRDMRFRVLGVSRAMGEVAYSVISVGAAVFGWGGFAVVFGNLARSVLRVGLVIATTDRREWLTPTWLRRDVTRQLFTFGLPLSIASFASFASRRWDNLLISRFFGPGVLGTYNLAYNLADVPAVHVGEQIGDVLLPSFAYLEPKRRLGALIRAMRLIGLTVFPLAIGLGAIAATVTATFFDERWADVGPMLTILSALSVTRPLGWTTWSYFLAVERTRTAMILELVKVAALIGALVTMGRIGPLWACAAVGVGFALHALLSLWTVHRFEDSPSFLDLIVGLVPPLLACAPMVAAVYGTRLALASVPAGWRLGAEIVVGAGVYVLSALVIAPATSRELVRLLRDAMQRRS